MAIIQSKIAEIPTPSPTTRDADDDRRNGRRNQKKHAKSECRRGFVARLHRVKEKPGQQEQQHQPKHKTRAPLQNLVPRNNARDE